ncbi:MAG: hypothetical protein LBJ67_02075, partial [Planctomycetaceae bacterium]|nr:hypothetical protein [Planctomycetaceae bacterium]
QAVQNVMDDFIGRHSMVSCDECYDSECDVQGSHRDLVETHKNDAEPRKILVSNNDWRTFSIKIFRINGDLIIKVVTRLLGMDLSGLGN